MPEAPEVWTIDPTKVTLVVDGFTITGFADGEYIVAERNRNRFSLSVGAYGHALRAKDMDASGVIRFRLYPTAPFITSGKLRELENKDEPIAVVCTDNNDADKGFVAEKAWVQRPTPYRRNKEATGMVYEVVIETHNLVLK